jgi:tetratricopeptide (TPR) repeat protein
MRMFNRLWKFLSEENNRKTLAFISGGIATLIVGIWAVYVHFSDKNSSPKQHIEAKEGSVATGGNITAGGDIHFGITLEKHEASLKRKEEEIREEYAVSALSSERRALLEKKLAALQQKRTHLEESLKATQKVYADTVQLLEEKLSAQLPSERIEQAKKAITEGDPALAESLLNEVVESGMQQSAKASYQLGVLANNRVNYEKAWQALTRAVELAPDNPFYLNQTGNMARNLGRYDTAIAYFEKALDLGLKAHGPKHPSVATYWNNLGLAWKAKGEYDKAIEYLDKALASNLKTFGPGHPYVATNWNNLGSTLTNKGDYDKAIEYLDKALASGLKNFGPGHSNVAANWKNLGMAWKAKGEYDKAIEYYEKALASDLKTFGPDHPRVASRWNNLGTAWLAKGEYDKAIEYLGKALASDLKTYGRDHPAVAIDWNNLGEAWRARGDYGKAREYYSKALVVVKKAGLEHYVRVTEENIRSLPPEK